MTETVIDSTEGGVVELRRYTLHPGRRDELIELFEREFIDTQREVGIDVIGQFRDLDHPDVFTWLRGFPDMAARQRSLAEFYGGPAWAQHRSAANATMIDSDDVLLLTTIEPPRPSPPEPSGNTTRRFDVLTFHLVEDLNRTGLSDLRAALSDVNGWTLELFLRTLPAENNFPALPVRGDANVVVAALASTGSAPAAPWSGIGSEVAAIASTEVLHLVPTERSLMQ
jgi:hypothetical protein